MAPRTVWFATTRARDPCTDAFGASPEEPPDRVWAGFARCTPAASPAKEGRCHDHTTAHPGAPARGLADTLRDWTSDPEAVPLLIVHGFGHAFRDALTRAADLAAWLEAGTPKLRLAPLAFTWPSDGVQSIPAYKADRRDAASAAPGFAVLLRAISALRLPEGRRPALLAHSMGVYATRCGVQKIAPALDALRLPLFRHALLMAGDDGADVFSPEPSASGSAGGLRPLAQLAAQVSVFFHQQDGVVRYLSGTINGGARLGASGPKPARGLPANVSAEDVSGIVTMPSPWEADPVPIGAATPDWIAHQYHRNHPEVRKMVLARIADA